VSEVPVLPGIERAVVTPRSRRRIRLPVIGVCFFIVAVVLVMAIFGSLLAPQNPSTQNLTEVLAPASGAHWLGTDALGRDIFSRLIVGASTAFFGPLIIAAGSFAFGNLLGLLAGYRGGRWDSVIMRWVDLMWSIPALLVLIVITGAVGSSYWLAVALLVVFSIPFDARIVRGATLEQVPRPYVEAAKTLGVADRRIMFLHVWPNVSPIAVANAFLDFSSSLVALAGLSFLGLGVPPGSADWGLMLSQNETLLFANPIATLAPGIMIVLTATAMNLIGDWLYERLSSRGATR
jgi:peptide/nickel transport system permease protein